VRLAVLDRKLVRDLARMWAQILAIGLVMACGVATIVTPNVPEAAVLLGAPPATSEADMVAQARELSDRGPAILLKGGHMDGGESVDILCLDGQCQRLTSPRVQTRNTHGTGCTLSSAIAAHLARGESLAEAVAAAKRYISASIAAADTIKVGRGHGPVHHFHALWERAG